ncbi:MAG: FAD-dependent oxidoreductase [Planctomycetes bacterium]|nr:FAD-dependent oxidoreductase [Planctomycetota bacterium]
MIKADVVVVGGSAAGLTAALTARRHYPGRSVLLIRKEQRVLIPCGIPYTFGVVGAADKNLIPADDLLAKNGIEGVVAEVTAIDREGRTVQMVDGTFIAYERLVLATGSEPVTPPIPGGNLKNVYAVRKDADYLTQALRVLDACRSLCIVGCGFIGVEIAEECKRRRPNLKVHIVEMLTHCLQLVYDKEFCVKAEETLRRAGVHLLLDAKVAAFEGDTAVERVRLADGTALDADMIMFGIGAAANTALARKAGLEIGPTRGIQVNRYMQTADRNIFACGDCAEKVSFFDGKPSNLKLASIATMEARIAGANLFATQRVNLGVIGVYSTVLDDCAFAAAGLTETQAVEKGYNVVIGESEAINRHPACMPGGTPLKVKLIFEAGSQVLIGGQVTGARSGGELINAISACIHQRMTADDVATFQTGTHPALTASPIAYQLVDAAEVAISRTKR